MWLIYILKSMKEINNIKKEKKNDKLIFSFFSGCVWWFQKNLCGFSRFNKNLFW